MSIQAQAHPRRGVPPQGLQYACQVGQRAADQPRQLIDPPGGLGVEAEPGDVDEVSGGVARADHAKVDRSRSAARGQPRRGERVIRNPQIVCDVVGGARPE